MDAPASQAGGALPPIISSIQHVRRNRRVSTESGEILFAVKDCNRIVLLIITYECETPYVSEERPICRRRAHHGCAGVLPWRGNLLGDFGWERERRPDLRSEVALQTLESGLGRDDTRKKRSKRTCTCAQTDHTAGYIPCKCGTTGVCDSLLSCGKEVSGELQPQGMHVRGSFSSSGQLRKITRENNGGRSSSSDPRKGALTFFDSNCAYKKNNIAGELKESSQSNNTI